jgi:hypothetical protein
MQIDPEAYRGVKHEGEQMEGAGCFATSRKSTRFGGGEEQALAPVTSLAPVWNGADRMKPTRFANVSAFRLRFKNESKLRDLFLPSGRL